MTKKARIRALEKMKNEPWIDEPILICVRNCRRGAEPIAVNSFTLNVGSIRKLINRQPNESEEEFLDRVKEIGAKHIIKPKHRKDLPPAVILFQKIDSPPEIHEAAKERKQA